MVWGLLLPSTFGQFFPAADFEGVVRGTREEAWRERLNEYYAHQAPDEQKKLYVRNEDGESVSYASFVLRKFKDEIGSVSPTISFPLTPILEHELPRFYETEKTYKSLGSLIQMSNGFIGVNGAMKAIIERLEPNIHSFFSLEVRSQYDVVYPEPYYLIVIGQFLEGLVPEKCILDTGYGLRPGRYGRYLHSESEQGIKGLAVSKDRTGTAHLWRERQLFGRLICFSDMLVSEIKAAGLKLPKYFRMIEV